MAIAVIDVGTNTALLLIAELSETGSLMVIESQRRFVRLGEGTDRSGRISPAALDRLLTALADYQELVGGVDAIRVVGTSAARDASNREEVARAILEATGWEFQILTGQEEARYSHLGAIAAIPPDTLSDKPIAVVDIGGGSTEISISASANVLPSYWTSLQLGTVRLSERYVSGQPLARPEIISVRNTVGRVLQGAAIPRPDDLVLVGAAGTAVTLAMLESGRAGTGQKLDSPVFVGADALSQWSDRLANATFEEILAIDTKLMHGRADVIPVGAMILESVVRHLDVPGALVSPFSLRHGVALSMLAQNSN